MERVGSPELALKWLLDNPRSDPSTGLEASGWQANTWILHAMYAVDFPYTPSSEELARSRFYPLKEDGPLKPSNDLQVYAPDSGLTGYRGRRVLWSEYFDGKEHTLALKYRPGFGWFGSRPVAPAMIFPSEGSMDPESFSALLGILEQEHETECYVYFASLPANDFSTRHLWKGPVREIWALVAEIGYGFTPTNIWAVDRSWFTMTDYDLEGTQVCGTQDLVDQVRRCPGMETIDVPDRGGR